MNLLKCKKGQADNYFAVIVFLFVFGLISLVGYVLWYNFLNTFQATSYYDSEIMSSAVGSFTLAFDSFDYIIVIIMIVLIIGIGVTSYKISAPPVFFILTFIMGGFYGLVSYFFNYIFQEIVSNSVFDLVVASFPRTILILTNLHWLMLIMIVIGSITLYAKRDRGQYI